MAGIKNPVTEIKHLISEVKNIGKDAINKVNSLVNTGAHKINGLVNTGVNKITGVANDAGDKITGIANDAQKEIKKDVSSGLNTIRDEALDAKKGLDQVGSQIQHEIRDEVLRPAIKVLSREAKDAYHKLEALKHDIEKLPAQAVGAVLNELAKNAANKFVDICEIALPDELFLQFGPFMMYFNNLDGKVRQVKVWIDSKPDFSKRSEILNMIKFLTPYSVGLDFQAEASFLIISSKSLSIDVQVKYDLDENIDVLDNLIKQW